MLRLSDWTLWEIEYERDGGSVVLAVAKKKWKRNPNDLAKASRRLGDYQDGRARSCEVRLDD